MRHLILCQEYPPAPMPTGGIGTYVFHMARLLAGAGEIVHIIGQLWAGAPKELEVLNEGRLIIHRVPTGNLECMNLCPSLSRERIQELEGLQASNFPPQSFSWQACNLIEKLVINEGIDIIESQEYEAPLYYFQLRRALGLGPIKKPPCIVHLHSPTQKINEYNEGDLYHPYFLTAGRLEFYSIESADGLLCPSHYLAQQAETYFSLPKGAIEVIPLPIGDNKILERDEGTWRQGSICYVGRLERRKGVLEWVDAAVSVASDDNNLTFDFVGANCLGTERASGKQVVESRIPRNMRSRFRFWGAQQRSEISRFLLHSRIAVVPSRWENFPNTCVEAMCSGLPVIASPEGGMAEMIIDGRNGWLANNAKPSGLAEALKRALDAGPDEIALMGQNAARDIRRICDNQVILKKHLEFRSHLVRQGAKRSLNVPRNLPWKMRSTSAPPLPQHSTENQYAGIAIVVSFLHKAQGLEECLESIESQTRKPLSVIVLTDEWTEEQAEKIFCKFSRKGWQCIQIESGNSVLPKNKAVAAILGTGINPAGFVFIESEDRLKEGFIELADSVFQHCCGVGIVSCWAEDLRHKKVVNINPHPGFPFQWHSNELVSFSAIRTEALIGAKGFRPFSWPEYEIWDFFNTVMIAGWTAVTLPAVLGKEFTAHKYGLSPNNSKPHGRMCKEILERFPDHVAQVSNELLLLSISSSTYLMNAELIAMRKKLDLAEKYLRHPKATMWKMLRKLKNKMASKFPFKLPFLIDDIKTSK